MTVTERRHFLYFRPEKQEFIHSIPDRVGEEPMIRFPTVKEKSHWFDSRQWQREVIQTMSDGQKQEKVRHFHGPAMEALLEHRHPVLLKLQQ